jgi:hypothetical protein
MRSIRSVITRLQPHKRQIGRLVGFTGALLVSSLLLRAAPRTVKVQLELGPAHRKFVEVRVAYVQAGQELQGVAFAFPEGAPDRLQHAVRLPPGDFEVHTELRPQHGNVLETVARFHAGAGEDDLVHIQVPTEPL